MTGAATPCQLPPWSVVPAMEVQMYLRGGPHWPGTPAWPSTKPVLAPTKVTEVAWKLPGAAGSTGDGAELDGTADGVGDG